MNWKDVGENVVVGAASGAVIGSGVGLVTAAASAMGATATVATGIAVGGGVFATGFLRLKLYHRCLKNKILIWEK